MSGRNKLSVLDLVNHAWGQVSVINVGLVIFDGGFPDLHGLFQAGYFRVFLRNYVSYTAAGAATYCQRVFGHNFCYGYLLIEERIILLHSFKVVKSGMHF
ncbi:MAG: hypothetical protein AOA66_1394 [Candidatus Bathyarchaeota archaeon BA2]|nr:MAG: hypothetical protein AOA66_1394 [Candidatus Bathyarchaeota archaeon BA2]